MLDFVEAIENYLGKKAIRNYMPMQQGDVSATWANTDLLKKLTGYAPKTDIKVGVKKFIDWYLSYYKIKLNIGLINLKLSMAFVIIFYLFFVHK